VIEIPGTDNPTAKALVDEAKPEVDAGHFHRAHELLRQATQAQIAAAQEERKLKEQAQRAEDAHMLGAASSTAAEGGVAMTERRYLEAADLFCRAADYIPPGHTSEHGGYLTREAEAPCQQGDELGDNDALRSCAEAYRHALVDYPRSQIPLQWAAIQSNIGVTLAALGDREGETAQLVQAVAAYHAALEEETRARSPLDWAHTQNNLGTALEELGERESGTAWLEDAVAAYHAALQERTRDRIPLQWATTQMNLGNALVALGRREAGTPRFEDAVAAYRAALEEATRQRDPFVWATTQNNLGNALAELGGREGRRGWKRRWRRIVRHFRNGRAIGFLSSGRRRRTISALRSKNSASGKAGQGSLSKRFKPFAGRWESQRAIGFRSNGRRRK